VVLPANAAFFLPQFAEYPERAAVDAA